MKEIWIVALVFIVIVFIGEKLLRKKFNINSKINLMSKSVRRFQRIIVAVILFVYFIVIIIATVKYEDFNMIYIIALLLLVSQSFKAFMQWKYNRSANLWISEVFSGFMLILFLFTIAFFLV